MQLLIFGFSNMILIVANQIDPHVDAVISVLRSEKVGCFRIDLDSVHSDHKICLASSDTGINLDLENHFNKKRLSLQDVKTVWWRRGASIILEPTLLPVTTIESEESKSIIKWAIESLPKVRYPFGHPWNMHKAENKIWQIQAAKRVGFQIPPCLFSNVKNQLAVFLDKQDCIIKSLSHSGFKQKEENYVIAPKRIGLNALETTRSDKPCGFLQKEINREFDVRLFMGPDWAHACKIDLSNLPLGEIDWRMHITKLDISPWELEPKTIAMCREFLQEMELSSGHFDFIVESGTEEIWFLECNPNGQWYWLESLGKTPIAEDVAKTLIKHSLQ